MEDECECTLGMHKVNRGEGNYPFKIENKVSASAENRDRIVTVSESSLSKSWQNAHEIISSCETLKNCFSQPEKAFQEVSHDMIFNLYELPLEK